MRVGESARRPVWALPPEPPAPGGLWRWLIGLAGLALVIVPSAVVGTSTADRTLLAASLSLAGLGALCAAAALAVQVKTTGDAALRWAAYAFAAVPVLVLVRAGLEVPDSPLDVLAGGTTATPLRRTLELAIAAAATVAALLWLRRTPEESRHGHGWVGTGLVLLVLGCAGRALLEQRTGTLWWSAVGLTVLAAVVPGLGLSLVTCRRYRRQLRRWRHLEVQVRSARASSPLLPGLSVSPDDDDGLPRPDEVDAILDGGYIGVALQPVIGLPGAGVLGMEALARFGGRVPPDRWFRAGRRYGKAAALELLAMRCALSHLHTLPDDAFLALNLSPPALADDEVRAELRRHDLSRLVIEVTEHEAISDYRAIRDELAALRRLGARVAVDDTGAGFASLRHVLLLQPDVVKLDRTLILGIDHDARQRALVAALVALGEEVGVLLIGEGVETQEQLEALTALRLPAAQGFHLGVPVLQVPPELAEKPV